MKPARGLPSLGARGLPNRFDAPRAAPKRTGRQLAFRPFRRPMRHVGALFTSVSVRPSALWRACSPPPRAAVLPTLSPRRSRSRPSAFNSRLRRLAAQLRLAAAEQVESSCSLFLSVNRQNRRSALPGELLNEVEFLAVRSQDRQSCLALPTEKSARRSGIPSADVSETLASRAEIPAITPASSLNLIVRTMARQRARRP